MLVNLQQTPYDEQSSLRIFAKTDRVMELLASELGLAESVRPADYLHEPQLAPGAEQEEDVFLVPFDSAGRPTEGEKTVWDLRVGEAGV